MKKVDFSPLNSERIDNLRKEYLDQILAHPVCRKFIDKYDIKEDEINRNTSKFVKVIEDHKICTNCPGLNNCPKALKGIHFNIQPNGFKAESCNVRDVAIATRQMNCGGRNLHICVGRAHL